MIFKGSICMRTSYIFKVSLSKAFDANINNSRFIILSMITGYFQPRRKKSQLRITPVTELKRVANDCAP